MNSINIFIEKFINQSGYKLFFEGIKNTVIIAVFGFVLGFVLGSIISTIKILPSKKLYVRILQKICDGFVMLFRGTPMVVQLLLLHFALFPALGINIDSVIEAGIIFGLNSSAYMSEIFRGGIQSVDAGQMEAGRAMGLSFFKTMIKIVLPQAIKNILPTLGNELIALIKETSVVSFIAVIDLTKSLKAIAESTFEYFVPYIVLALIYLLMVMLIAYGIKVMEKKLKKGNR